jgi:hypothetical protein
MLERNREPGLGVQPALRDDGNVVVGWNRLGDRDGEGDVVLIFGSALPEDKGVGEKYDLAVNILGHDVEGIGVAVDLLVP